MYHMPKMFINDKIIEKSKFELHILKNMRSEKEYVNIKITRVK
jgi:hypothetical protein